MSGKPHNRDELIAGIAKGLWNTVMKNNRKAGNSAAEYHCGVDDLPKREAFVPTEP